MHFLNASQKEADKSETKKCFPDFTVCFYHVFIYHVAHALDPGSRKNSPHRGGMHVCDSLQ